MKNHTTKQHNELKCEIQCKYKIDPLLLCSGKHSVISWNREKKISTVVWSRRRTVRWGINVRLLYYWIRSRRQQWDEVICKQWLSLASFGAKKVYSVHSWAATAINGISLNSPWRCWRRGQTKVRMLTQHKLSQSLLRCGHAVCGSGCPSESFSSRSEIDWISSLNSTKIEISRNLREGFIQIFLFKRYQSLLGSRFSEKTRNRDTAGLSSDSTIMADGGEIRYQATLNKMSTLYFPNSPPKPFFYHIRKNVYCFVSFCVNIFLPFRKYAISQKWQLFDLYVCTWFLGKPQPIVRGIKGLVQKNSACSSLWTRRRTIKGAVPKVHLAQLSTADEGGWPDLSGKTSSKLKLADVRNT